MLEAIDVQRRTRAGRMTHHGNRWHSSADYHRSLGHRHLHTYTPPTREEHCMVAMRTLCIPVIGEAMAYPESIRARVFVWGACVRCLNSAERREAGGVDM